MTSASEALSYLPPTVISPILVLYVEEITGDGPRGVGPSLRTRAACETEPTLIVCEVSGARDDAEARAVARSVVSSSLVKAAVHGRDPNWGRIASATGIARLADAAVLEAAGMDAATARDRAGSPVHCDPDRTRIAIAGTDVFAGVPLPFDPAVVSAAMDAPEVLVRVDLGLGDGSGEAFGCDLTEAYVVENSAYST